MFSCILCSAVFASLLELVEHKKKLKHSLNKVELIEKLGSFGFRKVIQQRILTSANSLAGRSKAFLPGVSTEVMQIGGKHKSFDADRALVYAKTPSAMQDFSKEKLIKEALNVLETKDHLKIRDLFFSFQNEVISNDNFDYSRHRRVSIYETRSFFSELPTQNDKDSSLFSYYLLLKKSAPQLNLIENNIEKLKIFTINIIHQLFYIHYCLYVAKVQHGDMHMGNIKLIIDNNGFPILKAFDFGKTKIISGQDFDFKDLKYLLERLAVSGRLETFKRNTIRKEDSSEQQKHYPLHKFLNLFINNNRTNDLSLLNSFITDISNNLLTQLKMHKGSAEQIENFEIAANELVSIIF
ncbi:hypothetical protein QEJ31_03785 [Pigmentibacter sp. JX0631]|uniref:hypothetical protein n=1 Tax=Pigmentibacter sp. JX0631 TaxID=2976982 RepID=UPI00246833F6|nr:hypothetical protein [Pigmentibacter sp. JX0631]WGL60723.1 hypothetical protein QEJ31_03785 [Pigmentibacter sp. JX0631]